MCGVNNNRLTHNNNNTRSEHLKCDEVELSEVSPLAYILSLKWQDTAMNEKFGRLGLIARKRNMFFYNTVLILISEKCFVGIGSNLDSADTVGKTKESVLR